MGILPWLYCNQDFCIEHSGILYPVPKSVPSDAVSQHLHIFHELKEVHKGNTEGEPAASVLRGGQRAGMCELGLFQLIKSSFIKTGGWLLQHSHFPTQSESFKTQHAQNEIPSSMYYIDFIIDYLPRVTIWKPVRHNFFQLICLPGQLLLPSSNFPIDDDSTVKDGSSTVIIHFYPVGCNPKLSYTSFFFHEVNHHWEEMSRFPLIWGLLIAHQNVVRADWNKSGVKQCVESHYWPWFPSAQQLLWRHLFAAQSLQYLGILKPVFPGSLVNIAKNPKSTKINESLPLAVWA